MISDGKSNDSNCAPDGIVKEEPGRTTDFCKMSEKSAGGKNCKVSETDVKSCKRESNAACTNREDMINKKSNKPGANNQQSLSSVKLENSSTYSTCNLSNDCGGAAASKATDTNGKCKRNVSTGGESQFMQQQSQVFVFSTMLANKGAEAVSRGQYTSMVAYHCAQPGTKKFLEKHSSKANKSGQCDTFSRQTDELSPVLDPDPPSFWNEQSNTRNGNGEKFVGSTGSSMDDTINKVVNSQPSPHPLEDHSNNCSSPSSSGPQPSLQGVKVPDENLTPQQRQHREESLAALRKMEILLFPDRKESPENFHDTNQSPQVQAFGPDGVNTPQVSPLDNFPTDVDWDKFRDQLIEPKTELAAENNYPSVPSSGANIPSKNLSRSQGPPLPYNQSTRPASVPAALENSDPSSPNNQTSGQRPGYLPSAGSPMTQESLSSGIGRITDGIENHLNHSNPGTPVSQNHIVSFSPGGPIPSQEDSMDFTPSQSPSVDDILSQTLQSVNEEQRDQVASTIDLNEANLMPVPSPQQIQYLNTFEGQELTIQKQPNTNLKDSNSTSTTAGSITTSSGRMHPESGASLLADNNDRRFTDPLPSPRTPRTPSSNAQFDSTSLNAAVEKVKNEQSSPAPSYGQNLTDSIARSRTIPEPPMPREASPSCNKKQHQPGNSNDSKIPLQSNSQDYGCRRNPVNIRTQPDNVPLNPNNVNSCINAEGPLSSNHFDPITSLAQMSQQLASSNSLGDGPMMHSGKPPVIQQNMHSIQEMNNPGGDMVGCDGCLPSNYNPVPRPVNIISNRPPIGYGPMHPGVFHGDPRGPQRSTPDSHNSMRTNVQVKPGAPNTIQYLPAGRPNTCQVAPRARPSLDFLQGFTNATNQRCFAGNMTPMQNMQQGNAVRFPGMNRPQRPNVVSIHSARANYHPNQMRHHSQMSPCVHSQGPFPIRMQQQHTVGAGVFPGNRMNLENQQFGGTEMMTHMSNPRMYVPRNQVYAMGMRPRAHLHPGINTNVDGAGNNFKNGPFVEGTGGISISDSNYAQQYHNFQQQLYATGTRGAVPQHQNLHMGTNSSSFLPER